MSPHAPTLVALKTITLLLGGLITYFAYRAHSRTDARPLWYLAVGFGIVTLGTIIGGVIDQVLPLLFADFADSPVAQLALVIDSALTATGFAVIVYSLYTE